MRLVIQPRNLGILPLLASLPLSWSKLPPLRARVILVTHVQRIEVRGDGIEIRWHRDPFASEPARGPA
jgi:hypothetical protein